MISCEKRLDKLVFKGYLLLYIMEAMTPGAINSNTKSHPEFNKYSLQYTVGALILNALFRVLDFSWSSIHLVEY